MNVLRRLFNSSITMDDSVAYWDFAGHGDYVRRLLPYCPNPDESIEEQIDELYCLYAQNIHDSTLCEERKATLFWYMYTQTAPKDLITQKQLPSSLSFFKTTISTLRQTIEDIETTSLEELVRVENTVIMTRSSKFTSYSDIVKEFVHNTKETISLSLQILYSAGFDILNLLQEQFTSQRFEEAFRLRIKRYMERNFHSLVNGIGTMRIPNNMFYDLPHIVMESKSISLITFLGQEKDRYIRSHAIIPQQVQNRIDSACAKIIGSAILKTSTLDQELSTKIIQEEIQAPVAYIKKVLGRDDDVSKIENILPKLTRQEVRIAYLAQLPLKRKLLSHPGIVDLLNSAVDFENHVFNLPYDVVDCRSCVQNLLTKQSPSLAILLAEEQFRSRYHVSHTQVDTDSLEIILSLDKQFFENILPYMYDAQFLQNTAALIASTEKTIPLNPETIEFVKALCPHDIEYSTDIISYVWNLPLIKQAEAEKIIAPLHAVSGKQIHEIMTKWDTIINDLAEVERAKPYMTGLHSRELRKAVIQFLDVYGESILTRFAKDVPERNPTAYLRILNHAGSFKGISFSTQSHCLSLTYIASTAKSDQWNVFVKTARSNFEDAVTKAEGWITTPLELRKRSSPGKLSRVYDIVKGTCREYLFDMILDVRPLISESLEDRLSDYILAKQDKVANFFLSQLLNNMKPRTALRLMELYRDDVDFEELPPKELLSSPVETIEEKPCLPIYSPLDSYVLDKTRGKLSPQLVRTVIEKGFGLGGSRKLIGMAYAPFHHIKANVLGNIDPLENGLIGDAVSWLIKEGAIIHHSRKGMNPTDNDGCISVNPSIKHLASPMQEYIRSLLYRRT